MSEIEYDLSRKLSLSLKVGAETLDLLLLYADVLFFHV